MVDYVPIKMCRVSLYLTSSSHCFALIVKGICKTKGLSHCTVKNILENIFISFFVLDLVPEWNGQRQWKSWKPQHHQPMCQSITQSSHNHQARSK